MLPRGDKGSASVDRTDWLKRTDEEREGEARSEKRGSFPRPPSFKVEKIEGGE